MPRISASKWTLRAQARRRMTTSSEPLPESSAGNLIRPPSALHHSALHHSWQLLMSARPGARRLLTSSTLRYTRPTTSPRLVLLISIPSPSVSRLSIVQLGPRHYGTMTGTDRKDKNDAVLQLVQKLIPPLSPKLHKGQAGESPSTVLFSLTPTLTGRRSYHAHMVKLTRRSCRCPWRQRRLQRCAVLLCVRRDALRCRPRACHLRAGGRQRDQDLVSLICSGSSSCRHPHAEP